MNTDHIALFIEAVDLGSFAAVARARTLDPSFVSRAISSLEKDLGVRLLQRTTRTLTLTEAGDLFYTRARLALDELHAAALASKDAVVEPAGVLRITASVAFAEKVLVPALPAFLEANPALSVDFVITDEVVDLVANGIDLGFRLTPPTDQTAIATRLTTTRYVVVASPAFLATNPRLDKPSDLETHDCVRFPFDGFRSAWRFKPLASDESQKPSNSVPMAPIQTTPIKGRITLSNALAVRTAALAGLGPTLLATWLIKQDLASGALIALFPNYRVTATDFETGVWAVYPSRSYLPAKVRCAIDYFRPIVQAACE